MSYKVTSLTSRLLEDLCTHVVLSSKLEGINIAPTKVALGKLLLTY